MLKKWILSGLALISLAAVIGTFIEGGWAWWPDRMIAMLVFLFTKHLADHAWKESR